jgi:hypothetical protein
MSDINDALKSVGDITLKIDYDDGRQETIEFHNSVLWSGRNALAKSLANEFGNSYEYFISSMVFGSGGTSEGSTKFVSASRSGLYGPTVIAKTVSSTIDPEQPSQVIFTSVIGREEANGKVLNEMALRMANGDYYSMATFPDLNKTSAMSLTWVWRISFI